MDGHRDGEHIVQNDFGILPKETEFLGKLRGSYQRSHKKKDEDGIRETSVRVFQIYMFQI